MTKILKLKSIALMLLVLAFSFYVVDAYAQSTPPSTPVNTTNVDFSSGLDKDISKGVLQAILGDWKSSTQDPTIGMLFKLFNLGVLVFGACLFMYVSVVGTMRSAEDGEVLGRSWGSVFVPIRVAGGMALLFPFSNGFSGIQILVLWLATNGIGFANWVTVGTVDNFIQSQGSVIALQMIDREALNSTMKSILQAEVCIAELNQTVRNEESGFNVNGDMFGGPFIEQGTGANSYGRISWGKDPNASILNGASIANNLVANECGSITMPNFNSPMGGSGAGAVSNGVSEVYNFTSGAFSGFDINTANTNLRNAHFAAIVGAANSLRPRAKAFVSVDPNVQKPTADQLAEDAAYAGLVYRQKIADAMNAGGVIPSTDSITKPMIDGVKTAGWANLGTFFYQYARINTELSKMTSYTPKMTQPSGNESAQSLAITKSLKNVLDKGTPNPATIEAINNAGHAEGGIVGGIVGGSNTVTNTSTRWMGEMFGVDPNNKINAVMQLKNVGDNILTAAEVLYAAKLVGDNLPAAAPTKIASGAASSLFGKVFRQFLGDASGVMKYIGIVAVFSLLAFAMTLAFWIPMTPFILWLGAVCGWLIAVLEMVVAAPLWAAAHLHPEGEGMASKYGANGYMIVMEVFGKPVLMVIGFFIAARFVDVFLRFASGLFFNNMATVNADSVAGIVTGLAFFFMYIGFCTTMVNRCFALIHIIPNSVLRWIGAAGHDNFTQTGDISGDMQTRMGHTMDNALTPIRQGGLIAAAKRKLGRERDTSSGSNEGKKSDPR